MTTRLFLIGFISVPGQVILLRELCVAFYGVELIYILALFFWLLWTAAGALTGRKNERPDRSRIDGAFIAFALMLPGDTAFIRSVRRIFGAAYGAYPTFPDQILGMTLALMPAGILLGLLFRWSAGMYVREGGTPGKAYGVESLGGLAGGLAITLLFFLGIPTFSAALICGLLSIGILIAPGKSPVRPACAVAALVLAFLLCWSAPVDRAMTRWQHPDLLESRDSPYSRITVSGREGQIVFFHNDAPGFESDGADAEELCHLPALACSGISRVLILGGGAEGVVEEALKHGPDAVDYVELHPLVLQMMKAYLPERSRRTLEDPRVRAHRGDPRKFLDGDRTYDLILSGMPDPSSGASNRFYTREFFAACRDRLAPAGVLGFRFRSAENFWSPLLRFRNAAIWKAVTAVFPHAVLLPGTSNTVIASRSPIPRDPEPSVTRLRERGIETRLTTPEFIRYLYTNDRFDGLRRLLDATPAPVNSDHRPVCYSYSIFMWLSKFIPGMIHFHPETIRGIVSEIPFAAVLPVPGICLFGLWKWLRRDAGRRRMAAMGCAGCAAMIGETLLLLHYQSKSGILYQNIGLLFTAFMAGLWAGASWEPHVPEASSRTGRGLFIGLGLLMLLMAAAIPAGRFSGLPGVSVLLFATGWGAAAIFAWLSRYKTSSADPGGLYAADLIGGAAGALAGSLVLIPFRGMGETAGAMAILLFLSAVLI